MFTSKKRESINRFVCDASLYVAKTPKASIKYHKPPLPMIPCGIVAYGFVGQPFSKQLYTCVKRITRSFFVTQKRGSLLALIKLYYVSKFDLRRKPVH